MTTGDVYNQFDTCIMLLGIVGIDSSKVTWWFRKVDVPREVDSRERS